jgi:hypothetical protein
MEKVARRRDTSGMILLRVPNATRRTTLPTLSFVSIHGCASSGRPLDLVRELTPRTDNTPFTPARSSSPPRISKSSAHVAPVNLPFQVGQ